jgi:hypothetical protein
LRKSGDWAMFREVPGRKSLILVACGALAADASWLAAGWIAALGPATAEPASGLPHWAMPASEHSVELALECGARSLWTEDGGANVGPMLLLEDDKAGLSIADCIRHRSGGAVPVRKVRIPP